MDDAQYQKRLMQAKAAKERSYEKHIAKQQNSISYKMRDALNEIRFSNRSGSHVNCFRGSPSIGRGGESDEHLDRKYNVWKALRKLKHDVIVEPIFANYPGRGDVLDLHTCIIYEVVKSETEQKLAAKEDYYPPLFEIRKINANEPWDNDLIN